MDWLRLRSWRPVGLAAVMLALTASSAAAQRTHLHGFTDVRARSATGQDRSGIALGPVAVFLTSELAPRLGLLAETVFESDGEEWHADVERMALSFRLKPAAQFVAGRVHTPIGYWNNAYHHGALVQPTIERPLLYRFEDDGGLLPVHSVGAGVSGREIGAAKLGYDVFVGNGVGSSNAGDNDAAKAVTAAVFVQPTVPLRVGVSWYRDHAAAGVPAPRGDTLATATTITIAGGFVHFTRGAVEILAEAQHARATTVPGSGGGRWLWTGYAGLSIGTVTPYLRADGVGTGADPYFARSASRSAVIGARIDLAANVVVKFEGQEDRPTGAPRRRHLAAQIAVGF